MRDANDYETVTERKLRRNVRRAVIPIPIVIMF
jgi:hypothetical protein